MKTNQIEAAIEDLKFELWLRNRNDGIIVHTTKEGIPIPIKDMTDNHLYNTLNYMINQQQIRNIEEEAYESADSNIFY